MMTQLWLRATNEIVLDDMAAGKVAARASQLRLAPNGAFDSPAARIGTWRDELLQARDLAEASQSSALHRGKSAPKAFGAGPAARMTVPKNARLYKANKRIQSSTV